VTAATPPFPEAALRAVLAGTVAAWAGTRPGSPSAGDEPRRLYLDAFAGAEFQFGTGVARSGDEETRAAAAFRALEEAGAQPPPNAVFTEEDPAHQGRIYAELEDSAGGERLRATRDLASLQPGEISLLEAPFASVAAEVARHAAGARTFALLAPPAARNLPWDALRQIAALPGATLLIRLPHADFEKQSRHISPLADLPAFARRIVEGCSALLDDPKHAWLPAWRADAASKGEPAALAGVLERLRALIDRVAAGRILKPMELEAADGARTWLFLLTPDPAVALAANAAVRAAGLVDRAAAASPVAPPPSDAATSPLPEIASPPTEPGGETSGEATAAATPPRRKGRRTAASSRGGSTADAAPSSEPDRPAAEQAPTDDGSPAVREGGLPAVPAAGFNPPSEAIVSPALTSDAAAPAAPQAPAGRARPPIPPPARPEPVAEFLDLFPEQIAEPEYVLAVRPGRAALAAALEARFAGTTVTWRDLLGACAATDATPAELKAALAVLRRSGRAAYRALKKDDDAIEFPAEPVVREKPKRRSKASDDGGLFGANEEDTDPAGETSE